MPRNQDIPDRIRAVDDRTIDRRVYRGPNYRTGTWQMSIAVVCIRVENRDHPTDRTFRDFLDRVFPCIGIACTDTVRVLCVRREESRVGIDVPVRERDSRIPNHYDAGKWSVLVVPCLVFPNRLAVAVRQRLSCMEISVPFVDGMADEDPKVPLCRSGMSVFREEKCFRLLIPREIINRRSNSPLPAWDVSIVQKISWVAMEKSQTGFRWV